VDRQKQLTYACGTGAAIELQEFAPTLFALKEPRRNQRDEEGNASQSLGYTSPPSVTPLNLTVDKQNELISREEAVLLPKMFSEIEDATALRLIIGSRIAPKSGGV